MPSKRGFGRSRPGHAEGVPGSIEQRKPRPSGQRQVYATQIAPLLAQGLDQQAEPLLRLMAQSQAPLPEVLRDLGHILEKQGAAQEADALFRTWLTHQPKEPAQLLAQAQKADQLQLVELAVERYLGVLARQPAQAEALIRASELLIKGGNFAKAEPLLRQRLDMEPSNPDLLIQTSRCCFELGQLSAAANLAEQALALVPNAASMTAVLARHRQQQGDDAGAMALAEQALGLAQEPGDCTLVNRLVAWVFLEQGQLEQSEGCLRLALAAEPAHPELHLQLAKTLLLQQNLQEGFQEYRWVQEHQSRLQPRSSTSQPTWTAQHPQHPLALVAEGTLGDTLLFSRYAPFLKSRQGLDVRLYVQLPLHTLLQQALGDTIPVEPYSSLMQLQEGSVLSLHAAPAEFGTCQEHPELGQPHLQADPQAREHWRQLVDLKPGERLVGINWQGSPLQALTERHRSDFPLEILKPLSALPNTKLVSLQKGMGAEQLPSCSFQGSFIANQKAVSAELRFEQTAALMAQCDWILTDDSGPAHLAGCLGVPTIVLLPQLCNWRWGAEGTSTPWYPQTTLLRKQPGEGWPSLVSQACEIIENLDPGAASRSNASQQAPPNL
jgi:tetratricopeptide (TPR) repeat protein